MNYAHKINKAHFKHKEYIAETVGNSGTGGSGKRSRLAGTKLGLEGVYFASFLNFLKPVRFRLHKAAAH